MSKPICSRILGTALGFVFLLSAAKAWAQSYSHARIVRLSFVEGTVSVQRPDVAEWSEAPVNTPIQEGFKIATAENSFAEVEFETASTARIGERARIEFSQLALTPNGGKLNRLTLDQGYATFHFVSESDDVYEVTTPNATLTLPAGSKAMFRVDIEEGLVRVEVMKGSVDVASSYGSATLTKNTVLEVNPGAEQAFQISHGITKDEWDQWVEKREGVETKLQKKGAPGVYSSDAAYGWGDLGGYGDWSYLPGYGYGWIPLVSAGWSPFTFGRWCWYPGFGWTWISSEPWGWLPYHYGSWIYDPVFGWSWLPGSFGVWSPAQVVWYQGLGWIGWAPLSVGTANRPRTACPGGPGCTTAVSMDAFLSGKPVTPQSTIRVDPSMGQPVASPAVPSSTLAMLPGAPRSQPAGASQIALDPASGRFVNSQTSRSTPTSRINSSRTPTPVGAGNLATSQTAPGNAVTSPQAVPSGEAGARSQGANFSGMDSRPAPKSPVMGVASRHGGAMEFPQGSAPSFGRSSEASPTGRHSAASEGHSSPHSSASSAPASSSGSIGGGHGGGGLSGGGLGGGGSSGGGHSSAGGHR